MTSKTVPLVVLALAAAALLGAIAMFWTSPDAVARRERKEAVGATRGEGSVPAAVPGGVPAEALLAVDVHVARREIGSVTAELSAVLAPIRSVVIAAEVAGRVIAVGAEEHERVEKGAVLVEIERTFLEAAVERARAQLLRAEAAHGLAVTELERQRGLAQRDVASEAQLDRAFNGERASYAALLDARAALSDARTRLEKVAITAPFAGVINSLDLEPGAYLQPGEAVVELLDLSEIEVEFGVTDREVVALEVGDPVSLQLDVYPEERFAGTIAQIGRAANERSRKYPVQAHVPNPDGRLLASMLGKVRFGVGDSAPAIWIPRRALQREFELDYLFVLEEDSDALVVRRRRVKARPVPFRPGLVEVVEGLVDGERVAVSAVRELHEGRRVRVVGDGS
jgi:membrane fusion protein (multidrug efflux system)